MNPIEGDPSPKQIARHLIDPNRRPLHQSTRGMSALQVQRWVTSALISTVLGLLAAGMIVAAVFTPQTDTSARIGLNILASIIAVGAVVAIRIILGLKVLSAWPAVGLVVGGIGYVLTYYR